MLPNSLDEFKALHKKKFWYNLKRSVRLYEEEHGQLYFEILREPQDLSYFLDKVFYLFNKRWENEYTSAVWKTKEGFSAYKEAMIDLASTRNAFLAVLYDQNKSLLSYGFCLEQDNTIFFYQHTTISEHCYRNYSLGKVLIEKLLRYATSEKYEKFDFMAGIPPYKFEWAKQTKVVYRLIGKENYWNYVILYLFRMRYYLQFNHYSRRILKFVWSYFEKIYANR
jgi:CelD/BcsL family acetyltransferase involved in cellulose biosynthesis